MLYKFAGRIWKVMPRGLRLRIIRSTQKKFTASVGVIITNEEGKVLLLDHHWRPGSGWGIPGGFIEHGEQPAEAIRREILEETGLELEDLEMLLVRTINRHIEVIFRAGSRGTASLRSREIAGFGWFDAGDMPAEMNRAQRAMVEKVLQGGI